MPWFLRGILICGGWGKAPTTPYADSSQEPRHFHHASKGGGCAARLAPTLVRRIPKGGGEISPSCSWRPPPGVFRDRS